MQAFSTPVDPFSPSDFYLFPLLFTTRFSSWHAAPAPERPSPPPATGFLNPPQYDFLFTFVLDAALTHS